MTDVPIHVPEPEEVLLGVVQPTPEQIEEREKIAAENREVRRLFLSGLLINEQFRHWLREQLESFGTFENAFGAGPTGFPDPNASWFKAGMKAAGWSLWEIFDDASPELASLMRRETRTPGA